jgi:transcription antitermination factor NusG
MPASGEVYKFLDGPYKGLRGRVKFADDTKNVAVLEFQFASFVTHELAYEWLRANSVRVEPPADA